MRTRLRSGETFLVAIVPSFLGEPAFLGAGDAFSAAMLAWLHKRGRLRRDLLPELSSENLAQLLTFANQEAAMACGYAGADAPYRSHVPTPL